MYSIAWPNMFTISKTNLIEGRDAAVNNTKLLIQSFCQELFGDPQFGTKLNRYFFEQNCIFIRDLVIDTLYESIKTYIPQVLISRKDITVTADHTTMNINIDFVYYLGGTPDTFNISLTGN